MLISTLISTISHGSNDWLLDSGDSKQMTGYKESFINITEHESPHKVKLGDDYQYPIKGSGEASYELDSRKSLKMNDVLYVLGLKNNLLSIFALDAKGYVPSLKKNILSIFAIDAKGMRVSFFDG